MAKKIAKLPLYSLVRGHIEGDPGKIPIQDFSLEPVPNRVLVIEDKKDNLQAYKTNDNGVVELIDILKVVSSKIELRSIQTSSNNPILNVYFPSSEHVMFSSIAGSLQKGKNPVNDKEWSKYLVDYVKSNKTSMVELHTVDLKKSYFREPIRKAPNKDKEQYIKWYDSYDESYPQRGVVLPQVHAALLTFSDLKMEGVPVTITAPNKKDKNGNDLPGKIFTVQIQKDKTTSLVNAILIGKPSDLPKGVYEIEIPPNNIPLADKNIKSEWSNEVRTQQRYTLHEPIRFNIKNLAGSFDLINCDPITMEDALLLQFPTMLGHIIKKMQYENADAFVKQNTEDKNKSPSKTVIEKHAGLKQFANGMNWAKSKNKIGVDIINANSADDMGKLMFSVFENMVSGTSDESLKYMSRGIKAVYGSVDTAKSVKDFLLSAAALSNTGNASLKEIELVKDFIDAGKWKSYFNGGNKWSEISKEYVKLINQSTRTGKEMQYILDLEKIKSKTDYQQFLKSYPEKSKRLERYLGEKGSSVYGKAVKVLDLAITAVEATLATVKAFDASASLDTVNEQNSSLYDSYDKQLLGKPCREVLTNLEKFRSTTVAKKLDYDQAVIDAAIKYFDIAVGAAAVVPSPAMLGAQLILVVQGVYQIGKDVGALVDELVLNNYVAELFGEIKIWEQVVNGARANQTLMPTADELKKEFEENKGKNTQSITFRRHDGSEHTIDIGVGPNYYHSQFRIRSEALYGLMNLIIHAGYDSDKNNSDFEKQYKKLEIESYITTFILNDGWLFDSNFRSRISLDIWWLNILQPKIDYTLPLVGATNYFVKQIQYLSSTYDESTEWIADRPAAVFQRHFPIHKYGSDSLKGLAEMFNPIDLISSISDWVDKDETLVYFRPEGLTSNDDWELINYYGETELSNLSQITCHDNIRVLIVLKDKIEVEKDGKKEMVNLPPGIYPIHLQLVRTNGITIKGPRYSGIVGRLSDADLIGEEKSKFKGRQGFVFKPFYHFGKKTIFGIKPFIANSMSERLFKSVNKNWGAPLLAAPLIPAIAPLYVSKILGGAIADSYGKVPDSDLINMHYGFDLYLGKTNKDKMKINLGTQGSVTNHLNTLRVKLDVDNHGELVNREFLESHSQNFTLPKFFNDSGVCALYVKIGTRRMFVLDRKTDYLVLDNYNWKDSESVSIFTVVFSDSIEKDNYKDLDDDMARLPVSAELYGNATHGDINLLPNFTSSYFSFKKGPLYSSTLHYFGDISKNSFKRYKNKFDSKNLKGNTFPDNSYQEFMDLFEKQENRDSSFDSIQELEWVNQSEYPLYVSKFDLFYMTSDGKPCLGFKPIGENVVPKGGYYEYTLRNIRSAGNSGLNVTSTEVDPIDNDFLNKSNNSNPKYFKDNNYHLKRKFVLSLYDKSTDVDLRICVKAPDSNKDKVPWKDLSNKELEEWVVKKSDELKAPTKVAAVTM